MRVKLFAFLLIITFVSIEGYSQTKKELLYQVEQKNKSIDSLIKILENTENNIENRNRTIKFLREDVVTLQDDMKKLNSKISGKNRELVSLRKQVSFGRTKLKGIINTSSLLKVPEGKYWIVNQFFSDYTVNMLPDSLGNLKGEEIHVFIKQINTTKLTDISKNMYGPQVYSSMHPEESMQFPIVFTENTTVTFVLVKGEIGSYTPYEGRVYCTITERDN